MFSNVLNMERGSNFLLRKLTISHSGTRLPNTLEGLPIRSHNHSTINTLCSPIHPSVVENTLLQPKITKSSNDSSNQNKVNNNQIPARSNLVQPSDAVIINSLLLKDGLKFEFGSIFHQVYVYLKRPLNNIPLDSRNYRYKVRINGKLRFQCKLTQHVVDLTSYFEDNTPVTVSISYGPISADEHEETSVTAFQLAKTTEKLVAAETQNELKLEIEGKSLAPNETVTLISPDEEPFTLGTENNKYYPQRSSGQTDKLPFAVGRWIPTNDPTRLETLARTAITDSEAGIPTSILEPFLLPNTPYRACVISQGSTYRALSANITLQSISNRTFSSKEKETLYIAKGIETLSFLVKQTNSALITASQLCGVVKFEKPVGWGKQREREYVHSFIENLSQSSFANLTRGFFESEGRHELNVYYNASSSSFSRLLNFSLNPIWSNRRLISSITAFKQRAHMQSDHKSLSGLDLCVDYLSKFRFLMESFADVKSSLTNGSPSFAEIFGISALLASDFSGTNTSSRFFEGIYYRRVVRDRNGKIIDIIELTSHKPTFSWKSEVSVDAKVRYQYDEDRVVTHAFSKLGKIQVECGFRMDKGGFSTVLDTWGNLDDSPIGVPFHRRQVLTRFLREWTDRFIKSKLKCRIISLGFQSFLECYYSAVPEFNTEKGVFVSEETVLPKSPVFIGFI
jgi:hypothetical protein